MVLIKSVFWVNSEAEYAVYAVYNAQMEITFLFSSTSNEVRIHSLFEYYVVQLCIRKCTLNFYLAPKITTRITYDLLPSGLVSQSVE